MLLSSWGPGAGRKRSQAYCQSAVPTHPGRGGGFSGSEVCSLRTCLYFCNFYFLCYEAEGEPKRNEVPFRNASLSVLHETAYEESKSLLWGFGEGKKMGVRAGGGEGRGKGDREGGRALSARAESSILGNHTDSVVNPSPATSWGCFPICEMGIVIITVPPPRPFVTINRKDTYEAVSLMCFTPT